MGLPGRITSVRIELRETKQAWKENLPTSTQLPTGSRGEFLLPGRSRSRQGRKNASTMTSLDIFDCPARRSV